MDMMALFKVPDNKSETLTLRLTPKQKEQTELMARHEHVSVSRFILALIGQEYQRRINEGLLDTWNDGMPW